MNPVQEKRYNFFSFFSKEGKLQDESGHFILQLERSHCEFIPRVKRNVTCGTVTFLLRAQQLPPREEYLCITLTLIVAASRTINAIPRSLCACRSILAFGPEISGLRRQTQSETALAWRGRNFAASDYREKSSPGSYWSPPVSLKLNRLFACGVTCPTIVGSPS